MAAGGEWGGMSYHVQSCPQSFSRLDVIDLPNGLSLSPRLQLILTIFRSDPSPKPIDEWKIKSSLIDFFRESFSLSIPDDDVKIHRCAELKKRKRHDPVASGTVFVRDLGFLQCSRETVIVRNDKENEVNILDNRFLDWRNSVLAKMDGMELNTEGVKFLLKADIPAGDDFERIRQSFIGARYAGNYWKSGKQPLDAIVLKDLPSRWFAEPRVSSKPSMLVTHTIFSVFGKIRNLSVTGDDTHGNLIEGDKGNVIVSALQCSISVQFEKYEDICSALKRFCGRSMRKALAFMQIMWYLMTEAIFLLVINRRDQLEVNCMLGITPGWEPQKFI